MFFLNAFYDFEEQFGRADTKPNHFLTKPFTDQNRVETTMKAVERMKQGIYWGSKTDRW